ncbi:hypothetical protein AeMF1_003306, partial [Aphanomyces euteiches]
YIAAAKLFSFRWFGDSLDVWDDYKDTIESWQTTLLGSNTATNCKAAAAGGATAPGHSVDNVQTLF